MKKGFIDNILAGCGLAVIIIILSTITAIMVTPDDIPSKAEEATKLIYETGDIVVVISDTTTVYVVDGIDNDGKLWVKNVERNNVNPFIIKTEYVRKVIHNENN